MTDEDWKALAAFEKVVQATVALKTALGYGILGILLTGLLWAVSTQGSAAETAFPLIHLGRWVAILVLFSAVFLCMDGGRRRLERLRIGTLVDLAAMAAFGVALGFAAGVVLTVLPFLGDRHDQTPGVLALLALPFQAMAAFSAGKSSLGVYQAQNRLSAPGICQRLTEALAYLESGQPS